MAAPTVKDCHAMVSYFEKVYKAKYGNSPNVNRVTARWGFDSVLRSMNMDKAKALLDYYLTTSSAKGHPLDWFFYHYDEVINAMTKSQEDAAHRSKLMEESKARAEKWRQRGKQSISDN